MPNSDANVANIVKTRFECSVVQWLQDSKNINIHVYMYNLHPSVLLFKPTVDSK